MKLHYASKLFFTLAMAQELLTIRWCLAILCVVTAPLLSPSSILPWLLLVAVLAVFVTVSMILVANFAYPTVGMRCMTMHSDIGTGGDLDKSDRNRGHNRSFTRRSADWISAHRLGLLVMFGGLAVVSLQALSWQLRQLPTACLRENVILSGYVADFPRMGQWPDGKDWQSFKLDVTHLDPDECAGARRLRVTLSGYSMPLALGDHISGQAILKPVPSQLSPGALPDQGRYAAQGIDAFATLARIEQRQADTRKVSLAQIRRTLHRRLLAAQVSTEARGVLLALVLGNGNALTRETWEMFQRLGLSHVLVISGLHVGLVAAALWWLAGLLRRSYCWQGDRGGPLVQVLGALGGATVYAALAGFSLPTVRALVMLCTVLLLLLLGWRTAPWRGLYLAVLLILLGNPFALLSSSLWMSAGATAVLLCLIPRENNPTPLSGLGLARRMVMHFAALLRLQTYLVLFMLPLTLFWFSMASGSAIVSNVLIVPIVAFWLVPLALTGALMSFVSVTLSDIFWQLAALPIVYGLPLLAALDKRFEGLALQNWSLTLVDLGLICALISVISRLNRHFWPLSQCPVSDRNLRHCGGKSGSLNPWSSLLVITSFILLSFYRLSIQANAKHVVITVLDVGQGTAVLLQNAGQTLLYDAGGGVPGGFTQARKIILPFLQRAGVDVLDTLVLSHRDFDHAGGRFDLAKDMPIKDRRGFEGRACRPGETWLWSSAVTITTLSGSGQAQSHSNDDSCVLLVVAYGRRLLLAGDISSMQERSLVRYWRRHLSADLLLVGHHGSNSSSGSTWLKWVSPARAIISAGYANRFGHPSAAVVDRLEARDAYIDNTAIHGTLRYTLRPDGSIEATPMRTRWTPFWLTI